MSDQTNIEVARVGKKAAGRTLDGRTHDGFPTHNEHHLTPGCAHRGAHITEPAQ